jgi:hypothetical protein
MVVVTLYYHNYFAGLEGIIYFEPPDVFQLKPLYNSHFFFTMLYITAKREYNTM